MNDLSQLGESSQYYLSSLLVGVEPGGSLRRGGLGTLLSPEASAVRQISPRLWVGASFVGSGRVHLRWGVWLGSGLVGWNLVNWIVDASILRHLYTRRCREIATTAPLRLLAGAALCGWWWSRLGLSMSSLCSFAS